MSPNQNGLRGLARDTAATGFFIMAWFGLLVGLLLWVVAGVKAVSAPGPGESMGTALGYGVLGVVFVLLAFVNRWLASGVLALRRGTIAAAGLYAAAWGLLLLLSPMPDPSLSTSVMLRTLGIVYLLGAVPMLWLLIAKKAGGDEA